MTAPKTETKFNFKYLLFLALVSAMGGFLFGYDWVVIGGAKPFYELFFGITDQATIQGWAVSSALVGCIFGAVLSGAIADRLGRKIPLIMAAALFTLSAFGTGYADDFTPFIIYRLVGGLGIGLASTLSPMYIAEIAPAKYRGQFVAINQLTIVIGILAAQIANYAIAEPIPAGMSPAEIASSWNGQMGWRWMFWAELIPAGLFFVLMFVVPKSPRFLAKVGDEATAVGVLEKIGGRTYAEAEVNNMKATLEKDQGRKISLSELKSVKVLPILVIKISLVPYSRVCLIIFSQAIYAMSLAPITWVVLSEIFPNRLRGLAMSIATLSLWIASFVLTFTFPILNEALGAYGTFWVYSGICVLGYIFIQRKLPETKGKSLEEIEMELTKDENG